MIRDPISPAWKLGLSLLSIALLIGIYSWVSHNQHAINPDDTTIPGWSQMAEGLISVVTPQERSGDIWLLEDTEATLGRLAGGVLIGVGIAILLGFLMGCWAPAEAFFLPPLRFIAKLNPMAMFAVFFVMFGTGFEMFTAMIAFGITPVLAQTIYLSAKDDVPKELIHKSYTLGASHMEVVLHVVFQAVLPKLIDGIRLLIGPALVYLIAAEMMVGHVGFGYRIRIQSKLLQMDVVYPYITILAGFGFAADHLLQVALKRLCPWYVFGGGR